MRLLLITNDYPPRPGGIQQYLSGLVGAYPGEVLVAGPADDPSAIEDGVIRNAARFMWPTRRVARWLERVSADFGPDVIVFGAPTPLAGLGRRLRQSAGIPYAVIAHGAEVSLPSAVPVLRSVVARQLRDANARLAVSAWTASKVEGLSGRPVDIIGTGVDIEQFQPAADGPPGGPPVVGCVSRFVPRKGQHRLLRAAAELSAGGVELEVLLVGRGRNEGALRRLADRLGVKTRFEVDVEWDRLGPLYREMDVFCMPCRSRWLGLEAEGFGLVFLEAAASGLPVLAGDSGGSAETVVPGETGFVVRSQADISEGIRLLLGDGPRAAAMGTAGRERVERDFTWEATASRMQSALERVVTA